MTPVPLQEDELAALETAHQAAKQKAIALTTNNHNSDPSTLRTVLTTGIRPSHVIMPSMQPPVSSQSFVLRRNTSNPDTIIPDSEPGIDENLLNMLAADSEDDPMLSPTTAKSLAGLTASDSLDTSLVLPNTVFSSNPVNQDVGGLQLMSSGKRTVLETNGSGPSKQVVFHIADAGGTIQRPLLNAKSVVTSFALPKIAQQPHQQQKQQQLQQQQQKQHQLQQQQKQHQLQQQQPNHHQLQQQQKQQQLQQQQQQKLQQLSSKPGISLSVTSTSSQTLRTLLSTSRDTKIIRLPLTKSSAAPVSQRSNSASEDSSMITSSVANFLSTTFSPNVRTSKPVLTQSFPNINSPSVSDCVPTDVSFTSESSRDSLSGLPSDAVTLSLDDLISFTRVPTARSDATKSDRESDLTSPGSVRSAVSEIDSSVLRSEDTEAGERLSCHHPNCGKVFDRSSLLKRHLKMHSGECRLNQMSK